MNTSSKTTDTRAQLRSLMNQHTAAAQARPISTSATPVTLNPQANTVPSAPTLNQPSPPSVRYTVRLSTKEIERLDTLSLEAHQRLGKRITVSEVFRIGLARLNAHAPITAEELRDIRAQDRRRTRQGAKQINRH